MAFPSTGSVVRDGVTFNNEATDMQGNLTGADVIYGPTFAQAIAGLPPHHNFSTATVEDVLNAGGNIAVNPNGNPNHCLLSGLTIAAANALFI